MTLDQRQALLAEIARIELSLDGGPAQQREYGLRGGKASAGVTPNEAIAVDTTRDLIVRAKVALTGRPFIRPR